MYYLNKNFDENVLNSVSFITKKFLKIAMLMDIFTYWKYYVLFKKFVGE